MKPKPDTAAFVALYNSEADKLFRFCYLRVSIREQAVDIVQESFTKLWDTLLKYHEEGRPVENQRAMLFAIAHHLIIDWYRRKKSVSLDDLIDAEDGTAMQFADPDVIGAELESEGKMLMTKIASLAPLYHQAVYLRFVEDLSPKEIADILNVSANVISVRIDRGLKELKKLYEQ